MNRNRISALVLAAGFSSRMNRFKPLLPLGDGTVLERVIGLYRSAGIEDIRCVTGHRSDELIPLLRENGVLPVLNDRHAEGMYSSVLAGIESLPPETEAFFLHPADIPLVRRSTLERLLESFERQPRRILHPAFRNDRGHPPLIPRWFVPHIRNWNGRDGLRGLLARHEDQAENVPVADRFVLMDLDTPEEYQNLLHEMASYDFPNFEECRTLMTEVLKVDERIWNHCKAVSRIAMKLGIALNQEGRGINLDLVRAAGLLHDAAKSEPDHARAGANLLRKMGYPEVAQAVSRHMDAGIQKDHPPCEAEIVYLADKLVQGDRRVDLKERFDRKTAKYGHDPEARVAIARRKADALDIQGRIEESARKSLAAILDKTP